MIGIIGTALIAYLLGSIPFAIIVTRIVRGVDVRDYGSKNAGATNVYRVAGLKSALAVGILDLFKGFVAVFWLAPLMADYSSLAVEYLQLIGAVSVVIGHMLTVFAGFKGGKGVLAAAGALLALLPAEVGISFGVFLVIVLVSRYISLGSILATFTLTAIVLIERFILKQPMPDRMIVLSVIITLVVIYAHRSNIVRLLKGTENKIGGRRNGH